MIDIRPNIAMFADYLKNRILWVILIGFVRPLVIKFDLHFFKVIGGLNEVKFIQKVIWLFDTWFQSQFVKLFLFIYQ